MRQLKISQSITNRSPALEKYLQEIGKEDMITAQVEVDLARRIKQGSVYAMQQLVKANLRFVVSVAKQYQKNYGAPLTDLINDGNVGLIIAAGRFDETRGFKFISYAVWWIRQSIMKALSEEARTIRLPLNMVSLQAKIEKISSHFLIENEREPTNEEIAEIAEMDIEKIAFSQSKAHDTRMLSLDQPTAVGDDKSYTLLDIVKDTSIPDTEESLLKESCITDINKVLDKVLHVDHREKDVVKLFFGIGYDHGMSLEEIGEKFDLTRERVRQLKELAIKRIQRSQAKNILKAYICR